MVSVYKGAMQELPYALLTLQLPVVPEIKIQDRSQFPFGKILKNKLIVLCERTAEEVSFEWSYYRISSSDSKNRTSLTDSGSERVKKGICQ